MQDIVLDNIKFPTGEEKDGARFRQIQEERLNRNFRKLNDGVSDINTNISNISKEITDIQSNIDVISSNFIIESGSNNGWKYRKWSDGRIEIWGVPRVTFTLTAVGGGGGVYHRGTFTFDLPFTLSDLETLQMTAYKDTLWYSLQNFTNGKTVSGYGYDVVDASNYSTYISVYVIGNL